MSKPVILTGLRANNDLHIGNYFGALLPLIDMAKQRSDEYEVHLFVPDLHSFTTPIDHTQLQAQIMHNLRLFVAAGLPLGNSNVHIYRQSYIPAHSELTWILDCFAGFGQMSRMTQFKDKSTTLNADEADAWNVSSFNEEGSYLNWLTSRPVNSVSVGLFNYPVLMAADILLYGAKYVPVGDDQSQHLEFTRDIAERMNSKFGQELFTVPEPVAKQHEFFQGLHSFSAEGGNDQPSPRLRPAGQGLRIKDLQDPTKKMSKSDETGKGIIFLGDSPDEAAKKIMSAATDSVGAVHLDYENQPGISNLLQLHALLSDETLEKVAEHHDGQQSYGDLKKEVAEQVYEFLADFQERLAAVDDAVLMQKLESDERAMNEIANATLLRVQKAVGLRPSSS
jgi:tryptophanyl-tRNA synthetase